MDFIEGNIVDVKRREITKGVIHYDDHIYDGKQSSVLPLPIAGLMSTKTCPEVAVQYLFLTQQVQSKGCNLRAPFMTLAFMSLLVIPELKLSDKVLFDV